MTERTNADLARENEELRARLDEAEDAIRALSAGEVDAVVVRNERDCVYTLDSADKPYRLLVEQMPQAAATLTVDGTILYCNQRFSELLGRPGSSIVGRPIQEFVTDPPREEFEALLSSARDVEVQREITLLRADGAKALTFLGVTTLAEGALGLCLMLTDLTLHRHYVELQHTQQALHDADRRKDEFLATLAHELRNPLAPIRNAVRILRTAAAGQREFEWAREVVDRQTQHMARLLEDLLDVSRISSGKLELRRERIELAAVIDMAIETSRPVIDACGHDLSVTLPPGPVWLDADPVRLAQVFANLLNNAAKYTESGGRIWLTSSRDGDEVAVSIRDRGIGIAGEVLPRIFTIFAQAEPALARSQGGLGIGLSLVKGLVDLHGGRVEARSAGTGQGSEFVVHLPTTVAPGAVARSRDETPAAAVQPLQVLVVDDNRDSADSLTLLLESMGHSATAEYDGEKALERGQTVRPDVMLLDIGMPKLNGYETCRLVRDSDWGREAVLVAITGWGQDEDRRRSRDAGFDLHVVKPVDPAMLLRRIAVVRERRLLSAE